MPPVCRSCAWGIHLTLTPALPQRGLLLLKSSLWHCWNCGILFCFPWLCVTCCWFLSSLSCMPSVSVDSIVWGCFPRPGSRRHPPTLSPPALTYVRSQSLLVFLPSGTSCSNLEALLPFFVQHRRDIPWRPALCTHLPLGPFPEVPSLGLPLTWRNPINTATGNALLWVPSSSQSHWWSSWLIS